MLKIAGAIIVIAASFGIGRLLGDNIKHRVASVSHLAELVDYISVNISLYKLPLGDIYNSITDEYLHNCGFVSLLDRGIYDAALRSGLLTGDEECEIIKTFGEKIGTGTAEDMEKLCSFTSSRLRNIEEQLRRDLPEKRKVYNTISFLAGASAVIILI